MNDLEYVEENTLISYEVFYYLYIFKYEKLKDYE